MSQVLSNIEVILLSIINEKPSYAYEIDKVIESRDMRRWVKIGVASIYQVLKRLEEKKLVSSQLEKEGKMPERKRYRITEPGKKALAETSKELLSDLEWFYLNLNVGLESSDCLTPDEINDCLMRRLARVRTNISRLQAMYLAETKMGFREKFVLKNLLYFRQAEESFLAEVLEEMCGEKVNLFSQNFEELFVNDLNKM